VFPPYVYLRFFYLPALVLLEIISLFLTGPYTASPDFIEHFLEHLVKFENAVVEFSVASSKCLRMWLIVAIYFC
jgi:hypothetical protein